MASKRALIPIFTTRGDVGAYLGYPFLYNLHGEWIGWIAADRSVYSIRGVYVGWISQEPRILRKLAEGFDHPRQRPLERPPKVVIPATHPLAPLMAELAYGVCDVLQDRTELLPSEDFGDLAQDMD